VPNSERKGPSLACGKESLYMTKINKESPSLEFKTGDWRSVRPIYLEEKCKQCGLCFPVCPENAIPVNKEQKREDFNYDYCKGCGICANVCPFNAIEMKEE